VRIGLLAGRQAEVLLAFAEAEFAGAIAGGPVAVAIGEVGTGAFLEGREETALVGFDAEAEDALPKRRGNIFGAAGILGAVFFVEPAIGGKVVRTLREGFAEAGALLFVEVFVVTPDGVEGGQIGGPGKGGAKEAAVGCGEDIGGGLLGGRRAGGLEARRAGEGGGGDVAGIEDFAGALGIESVGEEALGRLGEDDADGVEVFEEGDGDAWAGGADGETVAGMLDAEVASAEGAAAALDAADGEGATAMVRGRVRGRHVGRGAGDD